MPKLYCASCGHATIYDTSRPQFCSSCGKSFSDSIATKSKRSVYTKPHQQIDDDEDDYDDEDDEEGYDTSHGAELSRDKLRRIRESIVVEIDDSSFSTGTVGAVMKEGSFGGAMGLDDEIRNRHKKRISKKEFLREWQAKNGADKPASREVGAGVRANALLAEKTATPQKKRRSPKRAK